MKPFELSAEAIEAHSRALEEITKSIEGVSKESSARVGVLDFGLLFATSLMPAVNAALSLVDEAIEHHGNDLEKHREEFLTTVTAQTDQDQAGASAVDGASIV